MHTLRMSVFGSSGLLGAGLEDIYCTGSLVWDRGSHTASCLGLWLHPLVVALVAAYLDSDRHLLVCCQALRVLLGPWLHFRASFPRVDLIFRLLLSFLALLLKFLEGSCSAFYCFLTDWRATSDEMLSWLVIICFLAMLCSDCFPTG